MTEKEFSLKGKSYVSSNITMKGIRVYPNGIIAKLKQELIREVKLKSYREDANPFKCGDIVSVYEVIEIINKGFGD